VHDAVQHSIPYINLIFGRYARFVVMVGLGLFYCEGFYLCYVFECFFEFFYVCGVSVGFYFFEVSDWCVVLPSCLV